MNILLQSISMQIGALTMRHNTQFSLGLFQTTNRTLRWDGILTRLPDACHAIRSISLSLVTLSSLASSRAEVRIWMSLRWIKLSKSRHISAPQVSWCTICWGNTRHICAGCKVNLLGGLQIRFFIQLQSLLQINWSHRLTTRSWSPNSIPVMDNFW